MTSCWEGHIGFNHYWNFFFFYFLLYHFDVLHLSPKFKQFCLILKIYHIIFIISFCYLEVMIVSVIRYLLSLCVLYLNCFHFPWPDGCLFIHLFKKEVFLGYIFVWFLFQWSFPFSSLLGFISLSFCQWFTNILQWMLISFFPFYSSSVQFSCSVMIDSLRPHGMQHARPPCPSPTPRVYPNSCPLSQ